MSCEDVDAAAYPADAAGMTEYAFDVELSAVVRVKASSYRRAFDVVKAIEAYDVNAPLVLLGESALLTEVSLSLEGGCPITLFEKGGEPT
ncbi:hypothetical protein [Streptomyces bottropensis]|uniref:hypothetical protein n=1 Tax=Streptomyces bottropensis TaxID=42235 RepID=UPI0036C37778